MKKLTPDQLAQLEQGIKDSQRKIDEVRNNPQAQKVGIWFKMWLALGKILGLADNLYCPVCGEPAKTHLVFKCHPENTLDDIEILTKEKHRLAYEKYVNEKAK